MKSFIRDNPTIAFGLGLPLLLVLVIFLASGLPGLFVTPPVYDVIYATGYNDSGNGIRIQVVDKKPVVTFVGENQDLPLPHIWRYSPKTGAIRELSLNLPPEWAARQQPAPSHAAQKITKLSFSEREEFTLDPSSIAPDGYEFRTNTYGSSPELLTGFFFFHGYDYQPVLVKNGHSVRLPRLDRAYSYNTRFIGWVIPEGQGAK